MSFLCHRFDQNCKVFCPEFFYRKPQKASRMTQGNYKNYQGRNSYNIFVGFLVKMMTLTKPPETPKKLPGSPQEATKDFRAEIFTISLLLFWSKRWHKKDISKLTDLYPAHHFEIQVRKNSHLLCMYLTYLVQCTVHSFPMCPLLITPNSC